MNTARAGVKEEKTLQKAVNTDLSSVRRVQKQQDAKISAMNVVVTSDESATGSHIFENTDGSFEYRVTTPDGRRFRLPAVEEID